jgi:hypothetical protein
MGSEAGIGHETTKYRKKILKFGIPFFYSKKNLIFSKRDDEISVITAPKNSFYCDMKYEALYDEGGDSACLPYRPCAYCDDDVLPVQLVSYLGEPKRRG